MLQKIWESWKRVGRWIGDVFARVVLTIFYFTVFLPFGLASRLFSDPLRIKARGSSLWLSRTTRDKTMSDLRRQS